MKTNLHDDFCKLMAKKLAMVATGAVLLAFGIHGTARALVLTFDDLVPGATSYSYDVDGDGIDDIVFSTSDPLGFNTFGPGPNMSYISEPGIEGTSLLANDLRVDLFIGAIDHLEFGFALNSYSENSNTFASFEVYDSNGNLLAQDIEYGLYTSPDGIGAGSFPEGLIETSFSGVASYALFNFNSDYGRYIIDNFEGTFRPVPEPITGLVVAAGLGGAALKRAKDKSKKN